MKKSRTNVLAVYVTPACSPIALSAADMLAASNNPGNENMDKNDEEVDEGDVDTRRYGWWEPLDSLDI